MYDVIIIGGGWAGINAAITASKLGLKTALVEKDKLGGLCLNYGCIPTKSYFQSALILRDTRNSKNFGIDIKGSSLDFSLVFKRKNQIITNIRKGLELALRASKVDLFFSSAQLKSSKEVIVEGNVLKTNSLILATGSKPRELTNLKFDSKKIISSDELLNLDKIPEKLLIVGAGAIGCEFAWIFASFGACVTLIEKEDSIIPSEDREVARKLELELKKIGVDIYTSTSVDNFGINKFDKVLLCAGRAPSSDSLTLGVEQLTSNEYLETQIPDVYLVGDASGKVMLAHSASSQGKIAASNIYNNLKNKPKEKFNYSIIPNCIFVYPEIASIGINSESKAKELKIDYEVKSFSLKANGFCNILGETSGLIKVFVDKKNQKILGASFFCPQAHELINILVVAINAGFNLEEFKKLIFTHPSMSESLLEIE